MGREHNFSGHCGACTGCGLYVEQCIDLRFCPGPMVVGAPHVALIEPSDQSELRAVVVPVGATMDFGDAGAPPEWLAPYLVHGWRVQSYIPVAFLRDAQSSPGSYPAGDENEGEIRDRIASRLERLVVVIRRGDLGDLDAVLTVMEALAEHFSEDMADHVFNLRNHMVPYRPGEDHYDQAADEED